MDSIRTIKTDRKETHVKENNSFIVKGFTLEQIIGKEFFDKLHEKIKKNSMEDN